MTTPTTGHTLRYTEAETEGDARLASPAYDRAVPGLVAALSPWLGQMAGSVLEIGCGTGKYSAAFARAFPGLAWHPSDIDPAHRASAAAWAAHLDAPLAPALDIDAATAWAETPAVQALGPLSAVYASNVCHIAPWDVTEGLVRGAATALARGGLLILAGPFRHYGRDVGLGNPVFDARLRADNPDWGLRDIADIERLGERAGLGFAAVQALPANNRMLVLRRG